MSKRKKKFFSFIYFYFQFLSYFFFLHFLFFPLRYPNECTYKFDPRSTSFPLFYLFNLFILFYSSSFIPYLSAFHHSFFLSFYIILFFLSSFLLGSNVSTRHIFVFLRGHTHIYLLLMTSSDKSKLFPSMQCVPIRRHCPNDRHVHNFTKKKKKKYIHALRLFYFPSKKLTSVIN